MIWLAAFLIVWFVVVPLAYYVGYRRGVDRHTP